MTYRTALAVSLILIAVMAAISLWGWQNLPDNVSVAIHWDAAGHANGFADKTKALWMTPAIGLALFVLFAALPALEPRRKNLQASRKPYVVAWIGALTLIALVHGLVVFGAGGGTDNHAAAVLIAVTAMLMLLGNYLGKTRSNFFIGVRTPWSLSSDYAWEKSNRLGGRLLFLSGLCVLTIWAAFGTEAGFHALTATALGSVLIAAIASYVYWRRDPGRRNSSQ